MVQVKLLLLEDEPDDVLLIKRVLTKSLTFEAIIQSVENREEYCQALETFEPDIILSDYRLPQFSGLEALSICLTSMPMTPFVFVTGAIGEELAAETVLSGAWKFVLKTNLGRLNKVIDDIIKRMIILPTQASPYKHASMVSRLEMQIAINEEVLNRSRQVFEAPEEEEILHRSIEKKASHLDPENSDSTDHPEGT